MADDPIPDPEPETPEVTWKYGIFAAAKIKVALEHANQKDDVIVVCLEAADAYIESNLAEQRLELPTGESYPSSIVQAATNYAIGDALQPYFNSNEDKNEKVLFYMDLADKFLNSYITTELDKKAIEGKADGPNPYSISQSEPIHPRGHYPVDWLLR